MLAVRGIFYDVRIARVPLRQTTDHDSCIQSQKEKGSSMRISMTKCPREFDTWFGR